jgi:hypothetical protein
VIVVAGMGLLAALACGFVLGRISSDWWHDHD